MTVPYVKYLKMNDLRIKLGGRSRSSIYRDIELGRLPEPTGRGKRLVWIEEEVDDFLSQRRIGGNQS
jgi:prophage regulatory protein